MKTYAIALLLSLSVFAQPRVSHAPPHSYKVSNNLYRGDQPKDEEFAGLAHMGIRTVLDLRGGMFHAPRERKLVEAAGLHYVAIRLSGLLPPSDKQMAKVLEVLNAPANLPVFIHCKRGGDRTGLVLACYRISHDHWTNAKALKEAYSLGLSHWEPLMRSYILHFDARRLPKAPSDSLALKKRPN